MLESARSRLSELDREAARQRDSVIADVRRMRDEAEQIVHQSNAVKAALVTASAAVAAASIFASSTNAVDISASSSSSSISIDTDDRRFDSGVQIIASFLRGSPCRLLLDDGRSVTESAIDELIGALESSATPHVTPTPEPALSSTPSSRLPRLRILNRANRSSERYWRRVCD